MFKWSAPSTTIVVSGDNTENNNYKRNKTFKCIYNECNQKFIKSLDLIKHLESYKN